MRLTVKIKRDLLTWGVALIFSIVIMVMFGSYVWNSTKIQKEDKRDFSKGTFFKYLVSPTPVVVKTVKVGLVGDVALGRTVTVKARNEKNFSGYIKEMESWLLKNDINIGNLEGPVIKNCPSSRESMTFCADVRFLNSLSKSKMAFSLANNHILNYGSAGFWETVELLDKSKIPWVYSHSMPEDKLEDEKHKSGSDGFLVWEGNGIKVGILGWDLSGGHWYEEEEIVKKVEKSSETVDWLIVNLHWGEEYAKEPENWRVELGHKLVDAGADIIQGHHPHVVQKTEEYKKGIIFYSLGNFVFDQMWSEETKIGKIIELELSENEILKKEERKIKIYDYWQPRLED